MNRILDNELSQYTINYLDDNNITPNDIKMLKNYIKENKKLINNLKVYYLETKKINKYKTNKNNSLNEKINSYNSYKDKVVEEINGEIKVLLEMKDYFKVRDIINKFDLCSGSFTRKSFRTVTVDILNKESVLLKHYISNTNDFLEKRPIELEDISMQSYINDVLEITENNLKNQEEIYYSNYPIISKNQEYVRNIYDTTFNGLLKISSNRFTNTDTSKIDLYREIKKVKKDFNTKEELIDMYIDNSFADIDKIQESKMCNFTLFR